LRGNHATAHGGGLLGFGSYSGSLKKRSGQGRQG
jgi:hypothetical protein